jgi:phage terminase large subunit-like protein
VARKISRGLRAIRWIEDYCRIPEGQFVGQKVKLRPWQKKVIRGFTTLPTRTAIISFGRKNAKTTLSGFLCLLHLVGPEARANSQLYSCAQSRDQAAILFNLMVKVIRQSPDLNAVIGVRESAKQLYCEELGTLYRALSAESQRLTGFLPCLLCTTS